MPKQPRSTPSPDAELYALLDQLDRLEELLEEMDELGVASRADAERRLADLHAQVDVLAPDDKPRRRPVPTRKRANVLPSPGIEGGGGAGSGGSPEYGPLRSQPPAATG